MNPKHLKTGESELPASVLLNRVIRRQGLFKRDLCYAIQKDYDTLQKYTRDPLSMSGHVRQLMAKVLKLSIEQMDGICNGKIKKLSEIFPDDFQ